MLLNGGGIVVEQSAAGLEAWWREQLLRRDRVAVLLETLAGIARTAGRLVAPAASEGLVPVVRPRSLRWSEAGAWVVTEFAPQVEPPSALLATDVASGFVPPECIMGAVGGPAGARVCWGVAATLVGMARWSRLTLDGSVEDAIESNAGQSQRGRQFADAFARSGGGRAEVSTLVQGLPDPHRVLVPDRDAVLTFVEEHGGSRAVAVELLGLLDEALDLDPDGRPTPLAVAERLENLARQMRSAHRTEAVADTPAPVTDVATRPPDEKKTKRRVQVRTSGVDPSLVALEREVAHLKDELAAARTELLHLQEDLLSLHNTVSGNPSPPDRLLLVVGVAVGALVAMAVGVAGLFLPVSTGEPAPIIIQNEGPRLPSGASPFPAEDATGLPVPSGRVEIRGGTLSLEGAAGVFGPGRVPVGTYDISVSPIGGNTAVFAGVEIGRDTLVQVQCTEGVCRVDGLPSEAPAGEASE